jgi:predicted nucleic acid-binding protein
VQVLGELFDVLVRKGGKSRSDARDALLRWRDTFPVFRPIKVAAQDICGSKTAS